MQSEDGSGARGGARRGVARPDCDPRDGGWACSVPHLSAAAAAVAAAA